MSLVVYYDGWLAGDSVLMLGESQLRGPKVFPYRTATGEMGLFGTVGNLSAAHDLMKAYIQGGEEAYRKELLRLSEINEDLWCEMLIVPKDTHYMLLAGAYESLFRVPVQDVAIGFSTAVNHAMSMMKDKATDVAGLTALSVVQRVIHMQEYANDKYVCGPVYAHSVNDLSQEKLTVMKDDPINGQFII